MVDSLDYFQTKDTTAKKKMFSKFKIALKQKIAPKLPFNRYFNKSKEVPTSKLQAKPKLPAPVGFIENQFHYCENDSFNLGVNWYNTTRLNYSIDSKFPVILDAVGFYNAEGLDKTRSRISLSFDKNAWDKKQRKLKDLNTLNNLNLNTNPKFSFDNLNIKKLEYVDAKDKLEKEYNSKLNKEYKRKLEDLESNKSLLQDSISNIDTSQVEKMRKYVNEYSKLTEKLNETENYFNDYKQYTKLNKSSVKSLASDSLKIDSILKSKVPKPDFLKGILDSIENFQIGNALLEFTELSISGIPVTGFYFKKKGINTLSIGMGKMVTPSLFKFSEIRENKSFAGAIGYKRNINEYLSLGTTIFRGRLDEANNSNSFLPPISNQRFTGVTIESEIQILENTSFISEIGRSFSSLHSNGEKDLYNGNPDYTSISNINEKSNWAKKFELNGTSKAISSNWKLGYRNIGNSYSSFGRSAFLRDVRIVEGSMNTKGKKGFNSVLNLRAEKNNQSNTRSATVRMILLSWQITYTYKKLPTFFSTISPVTTTIWIKEPKEDKFILKNISSNQGYFYRFRYKKNHFMIKQSYTNLLRQNQQTKNFDVTNSVLVNSLIYTRGIIKNSNTLIINDSKNMKVYTLVESIQLSQKGYSVEIGNRLVWTTNETSKTSFPFATATLEKSNWKLSARLEKNSNSVYNVENSQKFWNLLIGFKLLI